jgi:uncharacterized membrane protein YqgA involved in biofilm formation
LILSSIKNLIQSAVATVMRSPTIVFFLVWSLYFCLQFYLHMRGVAVPDEYWFENIASKEMQTILSTHGTWKSWVHIKSKLGYGSGFWWVYALVAKYFGTTLRPLLLLRFFNVVLTSSVWLVVWALFRSRPWSVLLSFLLFLTMPMAWWTGKFASPDSIISALSILIFSLSLKANSDESPRRPMLFLASLFFGFGVGIKATLLPCAVPLVATFSLDVFKTLSSRQWSGFLKFSTSLIAAVLLGFCLTNFDFVHSLSMEGVAFKPYFFTRERILSIFQSPSYTWDSGLSGGFFSWSLALPALAAFIVALAILSPVICLITIVSCAGATVLIGGSLNYFGWYWFPTLVLLPASLLSSAMSWQWQRWLVGSVIIANLGFQAPLIYDQWITRLRQYNSRLSAPLTQRCVDEKIKYAVPVLKGVTTKDPGKNFEGFLFDLIVYSEPESTYDSPVGQGDRLIEFDAFSLLTRLDFEHIKRSSVFILSTEYLRHNPQLASNIQVSIKKTLKVFPDTAVIESQCGSFEVKIVAVAR